MRSTYRNSVVEISTPIGYRFIVLFPGLRLLQGLGNGAIATAASGAQPSPVVSAIATVASLASPFKFVSPDYSIQANRVWEQHHECWIDWSDTKQLSGAALETNRGFLVRRRSRGRRLSCEDDDIVLQEIERCCSFRKVWAWNSRSQRLTSLCLRIFAGSSVLNKVKSRAWSSRRGWSTELGLSYHTKTLRQ